MYFYHCTHLPMNVFKQYRHIYFLGIGGIGMSALARWFLGNGFVVGGYDRDPSALTQELARQGAAVHYRDDPDAIPAAFLARPTRTLVVTTPAIPDRHREKRFLLERGILIKKRAEVLGTITSAFTTLAVAGTHGKTTTSSLLTHMLKTGGKDLTAFVGGVMSNYDSNFILNQSSDAETLAVVEADEFDRSFLHLHPQHTILTTAEADHLDIYANKEAVFDAFRSFLTHCNGSLFAGPTVPAALLEGQSRPVRYGAGTAYSFQNIQQRGKNLTFDWKLGDCFLPEVNLVLPGKHNLENATAAAALALQMGVEPAALRLAMRTYRGVQRRFEFVLRRDDTVLIDDYAHHPTEVRSVLEAVRALYPARRITAIFQPHLYTRTRDFALGFAESLSLADTSLLLDVYPAREEPIRGVDSGSIFVHLKNQHKAWLKDVEFIPYLYQTRREHEVVVTLGAGPIYKWLPEIKKCLLAKSGSE